MNATLESVILDLVMNRSIEPYKQISFYLDPVTDEMEMQVEWADGTFSHWIHRNHRGWALCEAFVPSLTE